MRYLQKFVSAWLVGGGGGGGGILTEVCISMARWSRICRTMSSG